MDDQTIPVDNHSTAPQTFYKFLAPNQESPTGTGRWTLNRWRSVKGALVPCSNGLHATTVDNLIPFLSQTLWRVEIGDEYVWHEDASMGRKLVARRMRIVEQVEAWNEQTARLWACDVAERALHHFEEKYPNDKRPREAIAVARRFARGDATLAELNAAAYAANAAAANAAANAAVNAAAYAAANAAYAAVNAATYAAVNAATYAAVNAAAYAAAYAAERAWQARHLADVLGLSWDATVTEVAS